MIICKRPYPLDDHLQVGVPPDDHLQVAGYSGGSFARGQILQRIIFKRPDPPGDHFQEAGSSG